MTHLSLNRPIQGRQLIVTIIAIGSDYMMRRIKPFYVFAAQQSEPIIDQAEPNGHNHY